MKMFFKKSISTKNNDSTVSAAPSAIRQAIQQTLLGIHESNRWLLPSVGIGLILLVVIGIIFSYHQNDTVTHFAASDNKRTAAILNQLKDMNNELAQLSVTPQSSPNFKTALNTLQADVSDLHTAVTTLAKTQDVQKISTQITGMQSDLDSQLSDLKQAMNVNSKQYLDAKVLPFRITSIDVIAQQPFISIDYEHRTLPLMVGDTLAGWRVTAADYNAGEVELENSQQRYVKVSV